MFSLLMRNGTSKNRLGWQWGKGGSDLHVSGVSKVDPRLGGPFVASVLEADDALAGTELIFGEVSHVFVGFLRPDAWFSVIGPLKI